MAVHTCHSQTKFLKELYLHTFLHRFCFIHYFFDALMYYENRWADVRGGSSVYSDSEDSQQREANGRRPQSRVYQGLLPQLTALKAKQVSPFMHSQCRQLPPPITFLLSCLVYTSLGTFAEFCNSIWNFRGIMAQTTQLCIPHHWYSLHWASDGDLCASNSKNLILAPTSSCLSRTRHIRWGTLRLSS